MWFSVMTTVLNRYISRDATVQCFASIHAFENRPTSLYSRLACISKTLTATKPQRTQHQTNTQTHSYYGDDIVKHIECAISQCKPVSPLLRRGLKTRIGYRFERDYRWPSPKIYTRSYRRWPSSSSHANIDRTIRYRGYRAPKKPAYIIHLCDHVKT